MLDKVLHIDTLNEVKKVLAANDIRGDQADKIITAWIQNKEQVESASHHTINEDTVITENDTTTENEEISIEPSTESEEDSIKTTSPYSRYTKKVIK